MNKKMRDLQMQIEKCVQTASLYMNAETPDLEKAAAEMDKADELQKQFDLEARIEERGKKNLPAAEIPVAAEEKSVNGYGILAKLLRGRQLTDAELTAIAADEQQQKALISGANATNGENYLCPEDIERDIKEYRKSYKQARDFINVEPTDALTGKVFYAENPTAGLIPFDDGDEIDSSADPKFLPVPWTIEWFGALIAVSQILQDAEAANLRNYLNNWFVKRAIITENTKIFNTLASGYNSGTPLNIVGLDGMKEAVNLGLDPSCLINGFILTNQSGFNCMDKEKDENGRGMLQPDPTNPTRKLYKGLPVEVFADTQLENIDDNHFPIFLGDMKAGCTMKEFKKRLIALSAHYRFGRAQDTFRIIEGFAVVSTDTSAYIYGSLSATPTV